ncbi:unnamed protein product [Orchesella dallaii]|uniref:EGF-like domain-containing protein n=1 Tax=Orchesella dallaii TaxID=48710 RepID=A0ABP1Q9F6_9HEXA
MFFVIQITAYWVLLHISTGVYSEEIAQKRARASYGEHCNKTMRCDTSAFLSCRNTTCECQKRDSMFFDPQIKSCLTLVGEKCRYQLNNNDSEMEHPSNSRGFEEEIDCVQNAWCNRSGVCMCADDYVELRNGTCIPKRNYEETCTTDSECRQDRFLSCIDGQCGCNETVSTFNLLFRSCVGKVGNPCLGSSCVYNADCTTNTLIPLTGFQKRRERQFSRTCTCNPGFVADSSGHCKVGLSGQCSASKPCSNKFKCKDGTCVCKYENVQLPMVRSQQCISLVGGPCNETMDPDLMIGNNQSSIPNVFQCVDNAHCSTSEGNIYECKCDDGFIENTDGTCDVAFGENCNLSVYSYMRSSKTEADTTNFWNPNSVCDRVTPLFCINGLCQCESSLYEYNMQTSKCLGKVGAKCKVSSFGNGTTMELMNDCIEGAKCYGTRSLQTAYGKCICTEGHMISSNRTCLKI